MEEAIQYLECIDALLVSIASSQTDDSITLKRALWGIDELVLIVIKQFSADASSLNDD